MQHPFNTVATIFFLTLFFGTVSGYAQETDIRWYTLQEAQELAQETDKKVLVYARADWCTFCARMEREVFPRQEVVEAIDAHYYAVDIDIESDQTVRFNGKSMTQREFSRQIRVSATPTFFFVDAEGSIIGAQPGYIPADTYTSLLTYVGTDAFREIEFEEYRDREASN